MEALSRTEDIEAGCDLAFEERWWRIQRFCWVILSLLLVGGVVGVFGNGPLSKSTIHPPGSEIQILYERLARRETPCNLELHLGRGALASGQVRIQLNRELVDRLQIKKITPEPIATEPLADGACFIFRTDPALDGATILFLESPTTPGIVEGEITVEGAKPAHFRQFVYP